MKVSYLCWQCTKCGYWQNKEIRYEGEIGVKLQKTSLKCFRCNTSRKAKMKKKFGLNVHMKIFGDPRKCMEKIKEKNTPKN